MKRGEVKKAVYRYLDSLKSPQIIGGWALTNKITEITNYNAYPTVILKIAKEYAFLANAQFDCIDRERSIYSFRPGKKISGTHLEALPVGSHVKKYKAIRSI